MQPGGFDINQLMESAQRMQAEVARTQAALANRRATGSAGGGLVTAEVDGNGELVSLSFDPSVVDPDDTETLADLVVAAVRNGVRAAEKLAQEAMGEVAGGMLGGAGGLPGLPTVDGYDDGPGLGPTGGN